MSSNAVAISGNKIPAHITLTSSRGNENVAQNQEIARIKLLQMMTGEAIKGNDKYVEGAEAGLFYNTITGDLSKSLSVISVTVKTVFKVWQTDRRGVLGEFPTLDAANMALNDAQNPNMYATPEETDVHLLLIKNETTGALDPAIMDFPRTKLWVSRNWNSAISAKGGDRFVGVWNLGTQIVQNDKGTFHNLDISWVGWAQADDYKTAEAMYEQSTGQIAA